MVGQHFHESIRGMYSWRDVAMRTCKVSLGFTALYSQLPCFTLPYSALLWVSCAALLCFFLLF